VAWLLIVPGIVVTVWVAGVVAATDLTSPPARLSAFKKVLAVFSHPDDETVNCGGAIRSFSKAGAAVTLILLTGGERGNPDGVADPGLKAIRRHEAERVAAILGVSRLIQLEFADGRLAESRAEVMAHLAQAIPEIAPDLILTHDLSGGYGHPDHVACAESLIELKKTRFPTTTLWCVTWPGRVVRLMKMAGVLRVEPAVERRRASPTLRIFIGASLIPKLRAWFTYRSQRRSIARGFGGLIPILFGVSMLQFEYFAEVS